MLFGYLVFGSIENVVLVLSPKRFYKKKKKISKRDGVRLMHFKS